MVVLLGRKLKGWYGLAFGVGYCIDWCRKLFYRIWNSTSSYIYICIYICRIAKQVSHSGTLRSYFGIPSGNFLLAGLRFYFCRYKSLRNVSLSEMVRMMQVTRAAPSFVGSQCNAPPRLPIQLLDLAESRMSPHSKRMAQQDSRDSGRTKVLAPVESIEHARAFGSWRNLLVVNEGLAL